MWPSPSLQSPPSPLLGSYFQSLLAILSVVWMCESLSGAGVRSPTPPPRRSLLRTTIIYSLTHHPESLSAAPIERGHSCNPLLRTNQSPIDLLKGLPRPSPYQPNSTPLHPSPPPLADPSFCPCSALFWTDHNGSSGQWPLHFRPLGQWIRWEIGGSPSCPVEGREGIRPPELLRERLT